MTTENRRIAVAHCWVDVGNYEPPGGIGYTGLSTLLRREALNTFFALAMGDGFKDAPYASFYAIHGYTMGGVCINQAMQMTLEQANGCIPSYWMVSAFWGKKPAIEGSCISRLDSGEIDFASGGHSYFFAKDIDSIPFHMQDEVILVPALSTARTEALAVKAILRQAFVIVVDEENKPY